MDFGVEGGLGHLDQDVSLLLLSEGHLHRVQDLKGLVLGSFKAFGDNPGVETLANVELSLLQELSNQEDGRGGSVSSYIILQKETYGWNLQIVTFWIPDVLVATIQIADISLVNIIFLNV